MLLHVAAMQALYIISALVYTNEFAKYREVGKFAISRWRPNAQKLSASGGGGFVPLTLHRGYPPRAPLGARPQTAIIGSHSRARYAPFPSIRAPTSSNLAPALPLSLPRLK